MNQLPVVEKVWGQEEIICNNSDYAAKFLYVNPGYTCSMHRHPIKTETFHVLAGEGIITIGVVKRQVRVGDTIDIPQNAWHQFCTREGMTLLEVSTKHRDSDVERQEESHQLSPETDPGLWNLLYE